MKKLGMIGGTSWHSTVDYYRYINELTGERLESNAVNPPLILYSLNVELMRRGNWEEINKGYLEVSRTLQQAGAEAIVICANTPHKVYPYVQPKIDIPILHIADAIATSAKAAGLEKLGLLGTRPVTGEGFISDRLKEVHQIQTIVPGPAVRDRMQRLIAIELTRGIFEERTKAFFLEQMAEMKAQGAEGIILACTELPMLIKADEFDLPMIDTVRVHAEAAVDFILGE